MSAARRLIVCELYPRISADLATVEALARVVLVARRSGLEVRFTGASRELRELIALAGIDQALAVEAGRESEQREEPPGIEEEGELDEPPG